MDFLKIDNQMVKEQSLTQMGESMLGNGKMGNFGTEQYTTKTEPS